VLEKLKKKFSKESNKIFILMACNTINFNELFTHITPLENRFKKLIRENSLKHFDKNIK